MIIKSLELHNFRNYSSLAIDFDRRVNIFIGKNGQGKTNLLESIGMMSLGKSFRTVFDEEMVSFGKDYLKVKGEFLKERDFNIEIRIFSNNKAKQFFIDGYEKNKHADLLEHAYIITFTPDDLRIIEDMPERRRRFVDHELFLIRPTYYKDVFFYRKVLRQKNSLLKKLQAGEPQRPELLDVYDEYLAEYGSKMIVLRIEFVKKLEKLAKRIVTNITEKKDKLSIRYNSSCNKEKEDGKNTENSDNLYYRTSLLDKLREKRQIDISRGASSVGPHKDDIVFDINKKELKTFGSRGQIRTVALALKLAEAEIIKKETGVSPIILLDDVLSELDSSRQKFLINSLKENQLFITTAHEQNEVAKLLQEGSIFLVKNGSIKGEKD